MEYVLFFLQILWYTLGAVVVCGLCVTLFRRAFLALMGGRFGRGVVLTTSILGTPVHELGHALMCPLFGHRIVKMSLWQPSAPDGQLGYVNHAYNKRNLYHVLGNLFISIGPIFSGLGVITLALWLGFPDTFSEYMDAAAELAADGENFFVLFAEGLKMLPRLLTELIHGDTVPLWGRILALLVILSVSQHVSLSPEDIKGALSAIPLYLAIVLLVTLVCALIQELAEVEAVAAVAGGLALFSAFLTSLFVIVLVASLLQLLIALPVWGIRVMFGRH